MIYFAEYLRSRLDYDPETGIFTWKPKPVRDGKWRRHDLAWNSRYAGTVAGSLTVNGYLEITIQSDDGGRAKYLLHRLAWFYVTGEWPDADIDHKDWNKANNRFANLRPAKRFQNNGNRGLQKNNTSGVRGVYWNARARHWIAQIQRDGRISYLGCFKSKEEAAAARLAASEAYFGEYCAEVAAA